MNLPSGDTSTSHRRSFLILLLASTLPFVRVLVSGHVWDDYLVILSPDLVKGGWLELFRGIDSGRATETTPYYRPFTLLLFRLERMLYSASPLGMHLLNLILHGVVIFLVHRLGTIIGLGAIGSLGAALFMSVHPLNVESVAFLSGGRNTLLAACFSLGSLIFHQEGGRQASPVRVAAAPFLLFLGLLSKESALMVFPLIIWRELKHGGGAKMIASRVIPWFIPLILWFLLREAALRHAGVSISIVPGLPSRLAEMIFVIPRYLLNLVAPFWLSPKYFIPEDLNLFALPILSGWLAVVAMVFWVVRNGGRAGRFGLILALFFLLPVSGLVPIPSGLIADRYLYLPMVGVSLAVGGMIERYHSPMVMRSVSVVLLMLAFISFFQTGVWKNDETLFTRVVERYPDQAYGYHNLGCYYLDRTKDPERAERMFDEALRRNPFFPRLQTQKGYVRFLRGDLDGALNHYTEALIQNPFDGEALVKSGEIFELRGDAAMALSRYDRFLSLPQSDIPWVRPVIEERVRLLRERVSVR
ncbi:MAG: tetratricopeptide repeat protein [Desulfuromonadia bacterium]